jgi:hypothetical protein
MKKKSLYNSDNEYLKKSNALYMSPHVLYVCTFIF